MSARRCSLGAACAAALALAAAAASAQTIYRCGDRYSQSPCGADAMVLATFVGPTPAQRAEAREVVAAEKRLALEMTLDRRERERALRPAMASSLGPPHAAAAASVPTRKHGTPRRKLALPQDDGRDFIAAVPRAAKKGGG
jgi:hypothetical protein